MKAFRILPLLLALLLFLSSCSSPRFLADEDGYGFTHAKSGLHYTLLPSTYEAAGRGEEVGSCTDKEFDVTTVFYTVKGEENDPLLITDGMGYLYSAADPLPDASLWVFEAVMICIEEEICVEVNRLKDAAQVGDIRALWFEGEETELPDGKAEVIRRLKMTTKAHPGIYYCFYFYRFADGSAYFFDADSHRAVAVPSEVSKLIYNPAEQKT